MPGSLPSFDLTKRPTDTARPENPHTPPPVRECSTCEHEGNSIEDWPCRTSMNVAGINCWQPKKEAHHGPSRA